MLDMFLKILSLASLSDIFFFKLIFSDDEVTMMKYLITMIKYIINMDKYFIFMKISE
jgi:hypothetical protein